MRSLEWSLVQHDRGLCKKRKLGHRHGQRENCVRTQQEVAHPKARSKASGETSPADSGSSPHSCEEVPVCCCSHTVCGTWSWQPLLLKWSPEFRGHDWMAHPFSINTTYEPCERLLCKELKHLKNREESDLRRSIWFERIQYHLLDKIY